MAARGFAAHIAYNRQRGLMFVGLYALTFVLISLLVLGLVPLVLGKAMGSVLIDPLGFAVTFLPLAIVLTLTILATRYFGFRREVAEALSIREVTAGQEPRLVRIGEEQAILQGLARPQFGVIETTARNALSVGATPSQRMIAVTRGLMDALDDDEIAAVIAHELAHFRAGDAAFLSLNYALFQTAAWLQTYNPLKIDKQVHHKVQWHLVMMIALPIFLVALGLGGIMTSLAWRLTRMADASVRATRDFVADAEALRITHFPEALQSAITKCEGLGYFKGAERFEALLFSGNPARQGGTHPSARERIDAMAGVAAELFMPGRTRRDTRTAMARATAAPLAAQGGFGRRGLQPGLASARVGATAPFGAGAVANGFTLADQRPREVPREPGLWLLVTQVFDRKSARSWEREMYEQLRWRADDNRNFLGATPEMTMWFVGALAISAAFYGSISTSPADFLQRISGRAYFEMSDRAAAGEGFCTGNVKGCRPDGTLDTTSSN
jgi:Zn-dependent protease with chaperone function